MNNITIVLPSLNPDDSILAVVDSLLSHGFDDIVVVNDGSTAQHLGYFEQISARPGCTVLTHEINRGKGRALKTAFHYVLQRARPCRGVITVDGDNQHHIDDIASLAHALGEHDDALILGVRDFSQPDVPTRSRLGNRTTSVLLAAVCGVRISDTQTGLRAIPVRFLEDFCRLDGERFDYETNMLLATRTLQIPVVEIKIRTIYLNDNAASHYQTVIDSLRILHLVVRFAASSLACAAIDVGVYWLLWMLFSQTPTARRVFLATAIARVVSSVCNYLFNRLAVFRSRSRASSSLVRYYLLCAAQLLASWALVYLLLMLFGRGSVVIKMVVDVLLFFASFRIQRDWVFGHKEVPH